MEDNRTNNYNSDNVEKLKSSLYYSKEQFRILVEQSPIAIEIYDAKGLLIDVNKACLELFGITDAKEIKDFPLFDDPNISNSNKSSLKKGKTIRYESIFDFDKVKELKLYHTNRSGQIWLDLLITPTNDNKKPSGYILQIQDISNRKYNEEELQKSNSRFRNYFNISSHGVAIVSTGKQWVEVNDKLCAILGYSRSEIIKMSWADIVHPDDYSLDEGRLDLILGGKINNYVSEKRFISKEGPIVWVQLSISCPKKPNGDPDYLVVLIEDITIRKQLEQKLQDKEVALKKAFLASSEMLDSLETSINYKLLTDTILDISNAKYASFNLFDSNGLDFTTVCVSGINENLLKASSLLGFNIVNKKWKYDSTRDFKTKGKVITEFESLSDLAGGVISGHVTNMLQKSFNLGMVAVTRINKGDQPIGDFTLVYNKGDILANKDVVELYANQVGLLLYRVQTQARLEESEAITRAIIDSSQDAVAMMDSSANVVLWNNAATKMFGYEENEVLGKNLHHLIATKKEHEDPVNIDKFTRTGESSVLGKIIELSAKRKNGDSIIIELSVSRAKLFNKWHAVGIMRDITDKKAKDQAIADKVLELERLNTIMVGRELRMAELKKEVEDCKRLNINCDNSRN